MDIDRPFEYAGARRFDQIWNLLIGDEYLELEEICQTICKSYFGLLGLVFYRSKYLPE